MNVATNMLSRIYTPKSPGLDLVAFANSSLEDLEIQRMLHLCKGTFGLSIFLYLDICKGSLSGYL